MNMNNMDDVIQEFVCCVQIPPNCKECPQKGPGKDFGHQCRADVKTDVLHALEAYRDCIRNKGWQKSRKAIPEYEGDARSTWWYVCPECRTAVDPRDENCPECGLELDWAGLLPGKGKAWDKS